MKNRILSLLLTAVMLISLFAVPVSAAELPETQNTEQTQITDDEISVTTPDSEISSETTQTDSLSEEQTVEGTEAESIEALLPEADLQSPSEGDEPEAQTSEEHTDTSTEAFVRRLYQTLLLRDADKEGLDSWVRLLNNQSQTGADIISGFIHSNEFCGANYSDTDYVDILYRAFFDREPDNGGKAGWMSVLSQGFSRDYVCAGFLGSPEFITLCGKYGITPGSLALTNSVDLNPNVTNFVNRLYEKVLSRKADPEGRQGWVDALVGQRNTAAQAVEGFFYSDEFKSKNLDNSALLDTLYITLLDREADGSGKQSWLDVIECGVSQAYLLYNFVASQEFTGLCSEYGITRGDIALTEARDYKKEVTKFIKQAYINALGRQASVVDLNNWAADLNSHKISAYTFVNALIFSDECKARTSSDTDFIKVLYTTALTRNPSDSELQTWTAKLTSSSRQSVAQSILGSSEFSDICNTYALPKNLEGWNQGADGWYYVENGNVVSGWRRIGGSLYYLDPANNNHRAVGWTYADGLKYYFDTNGVLVQNVDSIIGKQSKYLLKVNTATNVVSVYAQDGSNGFIIPVKNIICSTGLPGTPTVKGTFTVHRLSYWGELMGPVWGQYISQIYGSYLFHSCWYYVNGNRRTLSVYEYSRLGNNASHGCVRLTVGDAKWIFDNCNGSTVTVYSSGNMDNMFDKPVRPTAVRISGDYGYDPTDPYFN